MKTPTLALALVLVMACTFEVDPEVAIEVTFEVDPCFTCYPVCNVDGEQLCLDRDGNICDACEVACIAAQAPPYCSETKDLVCENTGWPTPAVCVTSR